jgi:hypothetical protein
MAPKGMMHAVATRITAMAADVIRRCSGLLTWIVQAAFYEIAGLFMWCVEIERGASGFPELETM